MFARLGILLYDVEIDINKDIQEQVKIVFVLSFQKNISQ